MTDMSILGTEEKMFVSRLVGDEVGRGTATDWAKRLHAMLGHTAVEKLDDALIAGANTMLSRLAAGLRRDFDAINAALELPWTTSPVKGQISRIKKPEAQCMTERNSKFYAGGDERVLRQLTGQELEAAGHGAAAASTTSPARNSLTDYL